MAQELKSNLLVIIKPTLLYYLETPIIAIDGHICYHRQLIAYPVKPPRCITGSVGPMNGINKDVSGARLLPTTALTYPVD